MSHPTRVRGLKPKDTPEEVVEKVVAPYTGAWIETATIMDARARIKGRTLHGCVD